MSSRHCGPPAWTIPARPTPITVTPSCADSSFSQEAVRQKRVLCGVRRRGLLSQSVSASCETLQTPPVDSDSARSPKCSMLHLGLLGQCQRRHERHRWRRWYQPHVRHVCRPWSTCLSGSGATVWLWYREATLYLFQSTHVQECQLSQTNCQAASDVHFDGTSLSVGRDKWPKTTKGDLYNSRECFPPLWKGLGFAQKFW